jgi:hypothetical protein
MKKAISVANGGDLLNGKSFWIKWRCFWARILLTVIDISLRGLVCAFGTNVSYDINVRDFLDLLTSSGLFVPNTEANACNFGHAWAARFNLWTALSISVTKISISVTKIVTT